MSRRRRTIYKILMVLFVLVLSGCFSTWTGEEQGETGTITISLGGRSRLAVLPAEQENIIHEIVLTSGAQTRRGELTGVDDDLSFDNLPFGTWTITIWGWNTEVPAAYASNFSLNSEGRFLRAWGQGSATISAANPNDTETVTMIPATQIQSYVQFMAAVNNARTGDLETIVILMDNITITTQALSITAGRHVTLIANAPNITLRRGTGLQQSLFGVNGGHLQLGREGFPAPFTISGLDPNNDPGSHQSGLIFINNSGTLTMNHGVTLSGNTSGSGLSALLNNNKGSAVALEAGTFYMYGGTIENNSRTAGTEDTSSGVAVATNSIFYMHGGTIQGNTTSEYGGGVNVGGSTTATANLVLNIYGGTISGNTATDNGGGVYLGNATLNLSQNATKNNIHDNISNNTQGSTDGVVNEGGIALSGADRWW